MLKTPAQWRLENENSQKKKTRVHLPPGPERSLWLTWKQEADREALHVSQPPWHRTVRREEMGLERQIETIQHGRRDRCHLYSTVLKCFPKCLNHSYSCSWKCGLYTPAPVESQGQSFEEEKGQLYCFARQRRSQQANASKLCPVLRGHSKVFYRLGSEDRVIDKGVYIILNP